MFLGYPLSNWLGVAEWFGIMIILGVFTFCISAYLSNYMMQEEDKKNKLYQVKKNKDKKKQVFFDVA